MHPTYALPCIVLRPAEGEAARVLGSKAAHGPHYYLLSLGKSEHSMGFEAIYIRIVPHGLMYLNTWSWISGTLGKAMEPFLGNALQEEVRH